MAKQIVHYKAHPLDHVEVGDRGLIHQPFDHPSALVSNTGPIYTTRVERINRESVSHPIESFETLNTIYKPQF